MNCNLKTADFAIRSFKHISSLCSVLILKRLSEVEQTTWNSWETLLSVFLMWLILIQFLLSFCLKDQMQVDNSLWFSWLPEGHLDWSSYRKSSVLCQVKYSVLKAPFQTVIYIALSQRLLQICFLSTAIYPTTFSQPSVQKTVAVVCILKEIIY